jgi:hypothetical protein
MLAFKTGQFTKLHLKLRVQHDLFDRPKITSVMAKNATLKRTCQRLRQQQRRCLPAFLPQTSPM